MPREPAYADKRRLEAEAPSASERATDRMSVANVRRRGIGGTSPAHWQRGFDKLKNLSPRGTGGPTPAHYTATLRSTRR